jgi:hypothetical protein
LRGSNSSTPPKRSSPPEPKLSQLEGSSVQPVEQTESSQTAPQDLSYRSQIETEKRAFRLSNWNADLAIPSESIGLSPNQILPINEAGPSHLNLLQPIGEPSSEPIVSNSPSQSAKTSSSSEYYLPHVFCEGTCLSRLITPRVSLSNRLRGEEGKDIVLYENPIGLDDADKYYSTNGEPIVELKTLVQSKVKGSWNFLHQPFPTYWDFESNKDLREFSNLLVGETEFQRELIQAPIVPLASIVIFDRNFSNPFSEPIVNNQQLIVYNPLIVPLSNRINPIADQANPADPCDNEAWSTR